MGSGSLKKFQITHALFINPKSYYLVCKSGKTIKKAKGALKNDLDYIHFLKCYKGDKSFGLISKTFYFIKNLSQLRIGKAVKVFNHRLTTSDKRKKVYDANGNWVNTEPHNVKLFNNDNVFR